MNQTASTAQEADDPMRLRGGGCCSILCCPCIFIWGGITAVVSVCYISQLMLVLLRTSIEPRSSLGYTLHDIKTHSRTFIFTALGDIVSLPRTAIEFYRPRYRLNASKLLSTKLHVYVLSFRQPTQTAYCDNREI